MRSLQQFWSSRRIGEDRVTLARLGPLRLWLARAEKEWGFAMEQGGETGIMDIAQVPEDVVPGALSWVNMLFRNAPRDYTFRAVVPDRPVVVKPEHPVAIPAGETGVFFVAMPVFVEIRVGVGREERHLGTLPSRRMSDTWFGTPVEGDLCYSLPSAASMDFGAMAPQPNQIICQVEILNESDEALQFEKLCLRPRYVGIFCGATHLWSSPVRIEHEGGFKGTSVRYAGSPPTLENGLVEITPPQKREERRLQRLTFGSSFSKDIIFGK